MRWKLENPSHYFKFVLNKLYTMLDSWKSWTGEVQNDIFVINKLFRLK